MFQIKGIVLTLMANPTENWKFNLTLQVERYSVEEIFGDYLIRFSQQILRVMMCPIY